MHRWRWMMLNDTIALDECPIHQSYRVCRWLYSWRRDHQFQSMSSNNPPLTFYLLCAAPLQHTIQDAGIQGTWDHVVDISDNSEILDDSGKGNGTAQKPEMVELCSYIHCFPIPSSYLWFINISWIFSPTLGPIDAWPQTRLNSN